MFIVGVVSKHQTYMQWPESIPLLWLCSEMLSRETNKGNFVLRRLTLEDWDCWNLLLPLAELNAFLHRTTMDFVFLKCSCSTKVSLHGQYREEGWLKQPVTTSMYIRHVCLWIRIQDIHLKCIKPFPASHSTYQRVISQRVMLTVQMKLFNLVLLYSADCLKSVI